MYEEGLPNIQYDVMRKYLRIYEVEDAVSHSYMTMQPIPSEFHYTYMRKFDFLFISVSLFFHDLYFQV
jgi:hypothetical protein